MSTTLADFRTLMLDALGPQISLVKIDSWINGGYLWLCAHVRPFELERTKAFTLPLGVRSRAIGTDIAISDFFSIAWLRDETTGRRLNATSAREIQGLPFPNAVMTDPGAKPFKYARYAATLLICGPRGEVSDATYNMTFAYNGRPTKLVNASDPVLTTPEWDEVIFNNALWRGKSVLQYPKEERDAILQMNSIIVGSLRRRWAEEADDIEMGVQPMR